MAKRPPLTRAQIELCAAKKMSPAQAGRFLGRHHTTISAYAKEFGIELPRYAHAAASPFSTNFGRIIPKAPPANPEPSKKKTKAIWSASPAAIERALEKAMSEKHLQAKS
jgi:hypothetical protein